MGIFSSSIPGPRAARGAVGKITGSLLLLDEYPSVIFKKVDVIRKK